MTGDELLIRVYSFSYKLGPPPGDPGGNGGGFVFDCRGLINPGRVKELASKTGRQMDVANMLLASPQVTPFLESAHRLVRTTADVYRHKGFRDLMVAFGCTGGRHRSVYCADHLAQRLSTEGFQVRVVHYQMEHEEPRFKRNRAMILAAGLGTRLRPLTDETPKALVKAGGRTMLAHTLDALRKAELNELVVNAHHHAGQVQAWAEKTRKQFGDLRLAVCHEPEILGTGGGLRNAARWLHGRQPVIVHNADIWSTIDLADLRDSHRENDLATLAVQQREASSYLLVDEEERVCGLRGKDGQDRIVTEPVGELKPMGFTGIHVLSPRMLVRLAEGTHFGVIEAYLDSLREGGTIRARPVEGDWFDMGSPEKLERLNDHLG